jgi:bis(5'-nucleosyl)-tetraphosphatase (symmetrical)
MAIYAVGDVQGCFGELLRLCEVLRFDPAVDRLWFTGDLVNRGPRSLETLRFVRSLSDSAVVVLGNHDLHLLAVAHGISKTKHRDTFGDVLGAPDRDELLDWLRRRPVLHSEAGFYLIHAGLPPQWTLDEARARAEEVETVLRGANFTELFAHMYGDGPDSWNGALRGWDRLRFILNCLTRLRYCRLDGRIDLKEKGRPGSQSPNLVPWFAHPRRRSVGGGTVVFGHWSTLGFHDGDGVRALDTGCLWGGELTALRLGEAEARFSVSCRGAGYQEPNLPLKA